MKLEFKDGVSFNCIGEYRVEHRHDGFYVVGEGYLCPVDSEEKGNKMVERLKVKTK